MSTAAEKLPKLQFENISPNIGARILNPKEDLLSGELAAEVRDLLEQCGVLVLPEISFTDEEQVAFTKTLGQFVPEMEGQDVYNITLDTKINPRSEYLKGSLYWHIDGTMNKVPPGYAVLCSKVLPTWGGNTEFCNTYAAWDQLSEEDKTELKDLRVMHAAWASLMYYEPEPEYAKLEQMMQLGEVDLPLVWKHSSGRESLVLGCTAHNVIDKSATESTKILHRLRDWATQSQFVYSHEWSVGDAVIWDNSGTMHRAMPYDPDCGRLLHRTKTAGEEPITG